MSSMLSTVKEWKWEQEGSAMMWGELCWKQSWDGYKDEQELVLKIKCSKEQLQRAGEGIWFSLDFIQEAKGLGGGKLQKKHTKWFPIWMGVKSANWWQKFAFNSAYGTYLANRANRINRIFLHTNMKWLEELGRRSARQMQRSESKP